MAPSFSDGLSLSDFMPGGGQGADFRAERGEALPAGVTPVGRSDVIAAIQTVYDPEIPVNLWDLGLIYRCDVSEKGDIEVDMTLTAPGCPVAGQMPGMVADAIDQLDGAGRIVVQLVWEPGWTKDRMSEDARLLLDM